MYNWINDFKNNTMAVRLIILIYLIGCVFAYRKFTMTVHDGDLFISKIVRIVPYSLMSWIFYIFMSIISSDYRL